MQDQASDTRRTEGRYKVPITTRDLCAANVHIIKRDPFAAATLYRITADSLRCKEIGVSHTANEGIKKLMARSADLAIVGLALPDMDGIDLVRELHASALASNVLVISGRTDEVLSLSVLPMRWPLR
jgi:DNA-binding NarL/FixJ family response regulator